MRNIEKVIRPYCYKIIPLIYDDSLSYYEVLCKLRAKLNEVIEALNLNYNVADEVNRILNEWLEDGTLEEMIDSAMDNVQVIYPEYLATSVLRDGRYDGTASFPVLQSFCFVSENLGVALYSQPASASVYDGEKCHLIKFNPVTGLNIGYPTTIDGGHGNDIATDGGKLYIAHLRNNSDASLTKKITVTDLNFNFLYSIYPPEIPYVAGISYDLETELFYLFCEGTIYVYDKTLSVLQKTINLQDEYYRNYYSTGLGYFTYQTIDVHNGDILLTYSYPSVIIKFDENGVIKKFYNIENYSLGYNNYELEKCVYNSFDGNYYISSFSRMGMGDFSENVYGKFNLKTGQLSNLMNSRTTRENYFSTMLNIFVDFSIDDNAKMLGTQAYPFKTLQQAIDCLSVINRPSTIVILKPNAVETVGTIAIGKKSNIRIITAGSVRANANLIPNASLVNCDNIQLFYVTFGNLSINNCGSITIGNCDINDGNITLTHSVIVYNTNLTMDEIRTSGILGRNFPSNTFNVTTYTTAWDIGSQI